jgi:hypothetical protein
MLVRLETALVVQEFRRLLMLSRERVPAVLADGEVVLVPPA